MLLDVIASRRSRRVVLTHRVMPSLASRRVPSPSRRCHLLRCIPLSPLTRLFVSRAVVVALHHRRLASPVLPFCRSRARTRSISIAMKHQRRDAKAIRRRVSTLDSYRHQSLPQPPHARVMVKTRRRRIDSDHVPRRRRARRGILRRTNATVQRIVVRY